VSAPLPVRLVVTDLDGTLLDEDTYDVAPARPALAALREREVPVVLCSSKSRAEMEPLAEALGLRAPLIVENGGAIVFPAGVAPPPGALGSSERTVLPLGRARKELLLALPAVARESGALVRSFAAMSVDEVCALTGLSEPEAVLARRREWDEPFVAEDEGGEGDLDARLQEAADRHGLRVTRGGRFHHLTGPTDKGEAVRALLRVMPLPRPGVTVGLGDAVNDLPMLAAVDRPVVMPRKRGGVEPVLAAALPDALRAPVPGPAGWAAVVLGLLGVEVAVPGTR
jgi:mannosyl-3-phosphoglycerate phosphatase